MLNLVIATSTSEAPDLDEIYCTCALAAGDEVKVEIDDGAIMMACPRCGRQVSLETVSVHAAPRTAVLAAETDGSQHWLEVRI